LCLKVAGCQRREYYEKDNKFLFSGNTHDEVKNLFNGILPGHWNHPDDK
jgi:hypothetical protein